MRKLLCIGGFFIALILQACGQEDSEPLLQESLVTDQVELVVGELNNPWGMAFLPDGSLLITEKSGTLIHVKNGERISVQNVPEVALIGQGGLLDIELHPSYKQNGWIYLSYASPEGAGEGGNTAIMRARLKEEQLIDQQVLYKAKPNTDAGAHWGSRIEFDREGYLYFTIGDRYNRDVNPQDINRDGGKVYRLNDDGSIPSDNPFVGQNGAKEAIYSYGHRNPQGLAMHPISGKIWEHEHGPRGGDEINIIGKGKNYGWPEITYGINYSGTSISDKTEAPGMEQPLHYWVPSIAPCGMTFVSSDLYPYWKGKLLVGSLKFAYLELLVLENNKVVKREKLLDGIGRLRNVREAPDGYIYVAVEGEGIYKILPRDQ
jgi:glucose/arabinose dehydrogenase